MKNQNKICKNKKNGTKEGENFFFLKWHSHRKMVHNIPKKNGK